MTAAADHELFVAIWGQGPPVVFLHGLGASSRYWRRLAHASTGYRGIAPDLLGFGRSPKPQGALYDTACHLEAIVGHVPAGSVIVGHSTGAILAAALAAARPDLVRALVLFGLPAFPDDVTARADVGRLGLLPRLTVNERPTAQLLCKAMCALRPLMLPLAPLLVRDLPPEIVTDFLHHTWPSYSRTLLRVVVDHRVEPDLREALVPLVLVAADSDRDAPAVHVRTLADRLRTANAATELIEVAGDHHVAIRQSALAARLLERVVFSDPPHREGW